MLSRRDEGGHSAGDAGVAAVREEFCAIAITAAVGGVDAIIGEAAGEQLLRDRATQIHLSFSIIAASKGSGGAEHTLELGLYFRANLKVIDADAGPDGGEKL